MNLNKILLSLTVIFNSFIYSKTIIQAIPNYYSLTEIGEAMCSLDFKPKIKTRYENGLYPGKYVFCAAVNYASKLDTNFNITGVYSTRDGEITQVLPCKTGSRSIVLVSYIDDPGGPTLLTILDENGNFQEEIYLKTNQPSRSILEIGENICLAAGYNSKDTCLAICNFKTGFQKIIVFDNSYTDNVCIFRSGKDNFIVNYTNTIDIWSSSGDLIARKELMTPSDTRYIISSMVKLDNIVAVASKKSGKIRTFDINTLNELKIFKDLPINNISSLYRSKDKETLIAVSVNLNNKNNKYNPTFFILDVRSGLIINNFTMDYMNSLRGLAVAPNHEYFICSDFSDNIYLIDFQGNLLAFLPIGRWSFFTDIKFLSEDTFCIMRNWNFSLVKINTLNNFKMRI